MAHPMVIVDQAVRYFLHQWQSGLQPHLSLDTLSNGTVWAKTTIYSQTPSNQIHSESSDRRRSGYHSRLRRRKRRSKSSTQAADSTPEKNNDVQNSSSDLNDDQPLLTTQDLDSTLDTSQHIINSNMQITSHDRCIGTQTDEVTIAIPDGDSQLPIKCVRHEFGCTNLINSYYNEYTAICDSCSKFLEDKLQSTPYSQFLCPCCHGPNEGQPLSFCSECMHDLYQDGWIETGRGSWHLDRRNGKIVCINLDFN